MNSHPLVSVCIPTFNGAEYLQDALDCVLGQTYPNIEIVFSDDGSTDATLEIIEKFMNEIPFPSRLEHHQQTSLAGNWNNCIAHASGEYIKFLFQDDIMRHDCISKLMELFLLDSSIGLVFSPREMICGDEEKLSLVGRNILSGCSQLHKGWTNLKQVQCGTELLSDPALIDGLWNKIGEPSIVLLRRQVVFDVGGFDPNLRQWLDLDMWYRVMALSKVGFIDENLSSFRVHNHQVSIQNEESGVTAIDTLAFAEKIICSDYFLNLSPIVHKKLIKFVTPISWCKRTRRNLIRRAAALFSRLLGD